MPMPAVLTDSIDGCILCGSSDVQILETVPTGRVIDLWRDRLGIEIRRVDAWDRDHVARFRCAECALEFYPPELAGSDRLYERLQAFDWYYMPEKWEHAVALEDIRHRARVLEVGCATGAFVERVMRERSADALGIELNGAAVDVASRRGRPVRQVPLEALRAADVEPFDVVCSFQVLEHVTDPAAFLRDSLALLKPGGLLLFCIPNRDSFIRLENNPLDGPPHHVSRWGRSAIERLSGLFDLELMRVVEEPLASYHVVGYLAAHLRRLRRWPGGILVANPLVYRLIGAVLRVTRTHRFLRGHSIYACLRRRG